MSDSRGPLMVDLRSVRRTYGAGCSAVTALRDVWLQVAEGELIALAGRSGSGKTTLLNIISGRDRPDRGAVIVDGTDFAHLDQAGIEAARRDTVACIFHGSGLEPELGGSENVAPPLRGRCTPPDLHEQRTAILLELAGLDGCAAHRPDELSVGQIQQVAIARALAGSPRLLIADEPTGHLDAKAGLAMMALIRGVVEAEGMTAIVSTHDPMAAALADRVLRIEDGRLVDQPAESRPGWRARA